MARSSTSRTLANVSIVDVVARAHVTAAVVLWLLNTTVKAVAVVVTFVAVSRVTYVLILLQLILQMLLVMLFLSQVAAASNVFVTVFNILFQLLKFLQLFLQRI